MTTTVRGAQIRAVRIRQGDVVSHVYGELEGTEGVHLAEGQVEKLYDAPVKTTWKSGAFLDGSKQKHRKWLHRDMKLGFQIRDTRNCSYEVNDSEFRKMFDYELDPYDDEPDPTTIEVETDISALRRIDVLLFETPIFEPKIDPIKQQFGNLILPVRGGDPMWYELDPSTNKHVKTVFQSGGTTGEGFIVVENPTDQPIRQKWVLTRAKWVLPDVGWRGKKYQRRPAGTYKARVVDVFPTQAITEIQGGVRISLDGRELMVRDAHGTNCLPLMGGKFFMHTIPPYTPKTMLPISYTDAPAGGARAELIQPRRWSRPWGLE